ncbi:3-hydroxy-3-methylglutaryl-CoA lyase [Campylobacter jejuni]|nr:3-hydroxy-3-methylglutaryl-CoA lyase [Campylobacter jejuni]ECQ7461242.1 3-hydroxy-3-methylglutaryl-CoA lyase [Campylobacter jejuni]ECQ9161861.1 3-hydroxy-3-methylglutaryl-CoA lyase [Campylobacter jejuni]EDP4524843.1 3-hydroxy-3-methylglutaryl-CoA lyase [Campylobacter jejuni]
MKIKILDCTLRDGGYINNWNFKNEHICKILKSLQDSKVDIIECGYLNFKDGRKYNTTLFKELKDIDEFVENLDSSILKVAMINFGDFDPDLLPLKRETYIDGIRIAFHKEKLTQALQQAVIIREKGYKVFFQPMITKRYKDIEFLDMLYKVNELNPYAFYIVDSFGSMTLKEFNKYVFLSDDNLNSDIILGYHSHNNMQLAFANAINLSFQRLQRGVILDSSIYGIGRGAGNLNTELIMDYLNKEYGRTYNITPLLEIIDSLLQTLMNKNSWGFSPAQYLSASLEIHPNYANYLTSKNNIYIATIQKILNKIPFDKRNSFDKDLIEKLYIETLLESNIQTKSSIDFDLNKKIFLIAPGFSVLDYNEEIANKINSKEYIVIAINHKSKFKCDYYFFANQKRYDEFKELLEISKIILTNNISPNKQIEIVLDYKELAFLNQKFVSNAMILFLNYLIKNNIKEVEIAGFDGYKAGSQNYSYEEYDIQINEEYFKKQNKEITDLLHHLKKHINIHFITPSIYKDLE